LRRAAFLLAALLCHAAAARADDLAARGEYLARAGDCVACHSVPGGQAFAGGLKMGSPLGAIYSTNITPDPDSGIGRYSLADFDRAIRHGVARDGHHLYPAMPYPSYAKLTDEDVHALYSFFMQSVPPSQQPNRPNEIPPLLAFRWPLALWNEIFTESTPYVARADHDAVWNRGAYLVQGLGHCGACHTPRGLAWQEKALSETSPSYLAGAPLDGWSAPNLHGDMRTGLGTWSVADIVDFLKSGHNRDGSAFGSMIDVINNSTPYLSDADLNAIAVYLKSLPATATQTPYQYTIESATDRGATVYVASCATCHRTDGRGFSAYLPPLAGNPTVLDSDPSSLINIVLNGSMPLVVEGTPAPYRMPQFRLELTDQQIADVVTFIRASWGNKAAAVTAGQVASLRTTTDPTSDRVVVLRMR
jgi:mono/diheme cytochrome c family protein